MSRGAFSAPAAPCFVSQFLESRRIQRPVHCGVCSCSDGDVLSVRFHEAFHLIGKSMHQHTACSPIARERAGFGLRLNEGCCVSNGIEEFPTQSATLLFVPADGGAKL